MAVFFLTTPAIVVSYLDAKNFADKLEKMVSIVSVESYIVFSEN